MFSLRRAIISIKGSDATTFLQGLMTNDIHHLDTKCAIFTAFLSPQGKLLVDGFLSRIDHDVYVYETHESLKTDFLSILTRYKLRSQITIEDHSHSWHVLALPEEPKPTDPGYITHYTDPRINKLGCRALFKHDSLPNGIIPLSFHDYSVLRLSLAIPELGADIPSGKYYPLECSYDHLDAIDYQKGCYIGQEVTARSNYRGTMKKILMHLTTTDELPEQGAQLTDQHMHLIGEFIGGTHQQGFALIRKDAVSNQEKIEAYYLSQSRSVKAFLRCASRKA